jgi:dephospho-CoA kinase
MLKLRKVAITGGLSCGKSSVCRILKGFGAYVVSADKIVHQLLSSDTNLGQEIVHLLGSSVLVNHKLDRSRIAHIVFHDLELLKALEALVHPAVYRELNKDYQKQHHLSSPPSLFVAEIPLLFESGGEKDYDVTVAVVASVDICCKRFEEATGYDQKEFNNRMVRQLSLLDKAILADYVIMNNGTLSDLQQITKELYQELLEDS